MPPAGPRGRVAARAGDNDGRRGWARGRVAPPARCDSPSDRRCQPLSPPPLSRRSLLLHQSVALSLSPPRCMPTVCLYICTPVHGGAASTMPLSGATYVCTRLDTPRQGRALGTALARATFPTAGLAGGVAGGGVPQGAPCMAYVVGYATGEEGARCVRVGGDPTRGDSVRRGGTRTGGGHFPRCWHPASRVRRANGRGPCCMRQTLSSVLVTWAALS